MKKLLIATMAAVSVGLYAKATDTGFTENGTSFDDLTTGANFESDDNYWKFSDDDTGNEYKIIDVVYPDGAVKKHWDWDQGGEKALAIDTSAPLLRNANAVPLDSNDNPAQDVTTPVFFDSVVQFTATDVKPIEDGQTGNGTDKLMVWLYQSPENLDEGLFDETESISRVVVTAGRIETENGVTSVKVKNYLTDISVNPDTWHRLTIKSFINMDSASEFWGQLMFEVRVDGNKVTVDEKEIVFLSLLPASTDTLNLQGVAFDGKGAVDDIVFTTTDPFYVAPPETTTANVTITFNDFSAIKPGAWYEVNTPDVSRDISNASTEDSTLKVGDVVTVYFELVEGHELVSPNVEPNSDGYYVVTIDGLTADGATIAIETKTADNPDPETPTVVEPGQSVECDSEEAAKKVTITVTDADAAAADQAAVIKAVVKQNGNKWVVTAEIDTEATGYIPADTTLVEVAQKLTEIANATEDQDGNVTVALKDVTPGLYYSVDVSENLAGENQGFTPGTRTLATANGSVTLKVSKPKGGSAFFKVVQHLTKE